MDITNLNYPLLNLVLNTLMIVVVPMIWRATTYLRTIRTNELAHITQGINAIKEIAERAEAKMDAHIKWHLEQK